MGSVEVNPVTGRIGAIIDGVDISQPLAPDVVDTIQQAFWQWKVLFFRGQNVTEESQVTFTNYFGEVAEGSPLRKKATGPVKKIEYEKDYRTDHWHTDFSSTEFPTGIGVLWSVALPPYGGDTMWANMASAYLDMPEELRTFADSLWGVGSNRDGFADSRKLTELPDVSGDSSWMEVAYETILPLVRVHPETGERSLHVESHLRHILGYDEFQATDLRRLFLSYATRPENTVRWRWELGDVAMWDQRSTLHYAVADYDATRTLHRVSTLGSAVVSVDGRRAVPRIGDATSFATKAERERKEREAAMQEARPA